MRTLVFSDTHLGSAFDQKKFEFLKKIIIDADRVIIAGDFWEARLISFDDFTTSQWSALFPILKKKKAVYLFGNHDGKKQSDQRVNLFSHVQGESYQFVSGGKKFTVEHGDRFVLKIYALASSKPGRFILHNKVVIKWFHGKGEEILVKTFGKKVLQILYGRYNKEIKIKARRTFGENEILITGHTHAAELDLEHNYINTGIIRHGLGQYIIIDNGKILLREELYYKP